MRTHSTPDTDSTVEILFRGRKRLASFDALLDAALPGLAARLWQTCRWSDRMADGWKIGDHRFLIASISPRPDANLYVQFWSEPLERVLVEICSGNWNPGAVRYLRPAQRKAIEALGYTPGGNAGNYAREVPIASPAEAEAMAREALLVFWEVFNYRGACRLQVETHAGERAEPMPTHDAVTPEDMGKVAAEAGFRAMLAHGPEGEPLLGLDRGRWRSLAKFDGRVPKQNLFRRIVLIAVMPSPSAVADANLFKVRSQLVAADLSRDADGDILLTMDLLIGGGVTTAWLVDKLQLWHASCRRCARLLGRAGPRTRKSGGVARRSRRQVH